MGKTETTWELMKASWRVLMRDKELLLFPLISGLATLPRAADLHRARSTAPCPGLRGGLRGGVSWGTCCSSATTCATSS